MKSFVIVSLVLNLSLPAQDKSTFLRGEIYGSNPADHLFVEVYEQGRNTMIDRVPVLGDGRFEVGGTQSGGHYEVRVVRQNGEKLQSEDVVVNSLTFPVEIRLAPQFAAKTGESGPVSIYRLQHQVPGRAVSEFIKAEMAWKAGKNAESIERLEKALKLDPGYMEAHNNLGIKLLAGGQRERAAQEFRKSIELDPNAAPAHLNLAICLLFDSKEREKGREAEMHRKALQLDPSSASARFALGIALSWMNSEEALPYLRESVDRYPRALPAAANLLERLGRRQEARELRAQMEPQ